MPVLSVTKTHTNPRDGAILPAVLRLGAVHLTVADLDSAVAWYELQRLERRRRRPPS